MRSVWRASDQRNQRAITRCKSTIKATRGGWITAPDYPPNEPGVLQVVGIDQASCIERDPTQICDFWLARPWQALRAPPKLWPVLPPLSGRSSHRLGRVGSAYFGGFLLVKLCQNHSPAACSKPSACSKSRGMGWGQTSFVVRSDAVRNRFI